MPVVLGMLWGAPLVASELEARTSDFAWTQSVTRTRWLTVKAGWLLLAAVACGGAVSALTTWWSGPINAESATAFTPGQFDTQGIVPIGYAVFAMALGIAAGTVARRTLPAIAVVLGGFIALRLVIANLLRPHYMAAVTTYFKRDGHVHAAGAGLGARPGRRQHDRAGRGAGLGRPGARASGRLPAAAARGPDGQERRLDDLRVLLHASARLARVRHLPARLPVLAVPGNRDRDLRPAGGGADRGHVRRRPPEGRVNQTWRITATTLPMTAASSPRIGRKSRFCGISQTVTAASLERLHRGLAVDHGRDDVAAVGGLLRVDDHPVAVGDGRVDHRVACHPEHEHAAFPDQLPRQREDLLDLLGGQQRSARVDPADQGNVDGLRPGGMAGDLLGAAAPVGTNCRLTGKVDLHRARAADVAVQIALPLAEWQSW